MNDDYKKLLGMVNVSDEPEETPSYSAFSNFDAFESHEIAVSRREQSRNVARTILEPRWRGHQAKSYSPQTQNTFFKQKPIIQETAGGWAVVDSTTNEVVREFKSQSNSQFIFGGSVARWQAQAFTTGGILDFNDPETRQLAKDSGYEGDVDKLNFSDEFKSKMGGVINMYASPKNRPVVLPSELYKNSRVNDARGAYDNTLTRSAIFVTASRDVEIDKGSVEEQYLSAFSSMPASKEESRLLTGIHEFGHWMHDRLEQTMGGEDSIDTEGIVNHYASVTRQDRTRLFGFANKIHYNMINQNETWARGFSIDTFVNEIKDPQNAPAPSREKYSRLGFSPHRTGEHYDMPSGRIDAPSSGRNTEEQRTQAREQAKITREWMESRKSSNEAELSTVFKNVTAANESGQLNKNYRNFRMETNRGLRGGSNIVFDDYSNPNQPMPVSLSSVGQRIGVNRGTGKNRLGGFIPLPRLGEKSSNSDMMIQALQSKKLSGWLQGNAMKKDDDVNARFVGYAQTETSMSRINNAMNLGRNFRNRVTAFRSQQLLGSHSGQSAVGMQDFADAYNNYGESNSQLLSRLKMGTGANAPLNANIPKFDKRNKNIGRFDSEMATMNGALMRMHKNFLQGGAQSNVLMQATYAIGAQFNEGEAEKTRGLGVASPEEFEVDSSKVGSLEAGQYYGNTRRVGVTQRASGNVKELSEMGLGVSNSPHAYQILGVDNLGGGRSLATALRLHSNTMQKTMGKPGHSERDASVMARLGNAPQEFSDIAQNGRVHLQQAITGDLLMQARQSTAGAFAVLGEQAYDKAISAYYQENKDQLGDAHIADSFAVEYYTKGVTHGGKTIGGFNWTSVDATLSESRLSHFVQDAKPAGDEGLQWEEHSGKWHRMVMSADGTKKPIVDPLTRDNKGEMGYDVKLNDLVHISPTIMEMKASYGRDVANIKGDSFTAREKTDPSFAKNLRLFEEAGIGRTSATFHTLADLANRRENGAEYLADLGHNVVRLDDPESIDFGQIKKTAFASTPEGMTTTQKAERILNEIQRVHGNAFLSVDAGGVQQFLAPASKMKEMLTEGSDGEPVTNLASKLVTLMDTSEASQVDSTAHMKRLHAKAIADVVLEQHDYANTAKNRSDSLSVQLPAVTGHAQGARGLKSNQVAMYRSEIMRKTGLTSDEVDRLLADKSMSVAITGYPESDKTSAIIGANIVLADTLSEKQRKSLGVSGDEHQTLVGEDAWQALVRDYDADQVQLTFSHYADDKGNTIGGKQRVHTEKEIRAIGGSRYGNEFKNRSDKFSERAGFGEWLTDKAREAVKRVGIDSFQDQNEKGIIAKQSAGKLYNFGQRMVYEGMNERFGQSDDPIHKLMVQTAARFGQGVVQGSLDNDASTIGSLEDLANIQQGYVNIGKGTVHIPRYGEKGKSKGMDFQLANEDAVLRLANVVNQFKGDEQDLMARQIATMLMSPKQLRATTTSIDASSHVISYENSTVDTMVAQLKQIGNNPAQISKKDVADLFGNALGNSNRGLFGIFGLAGQDKENASALGGLFSGALAKRTEENADKYGFTLRGMSQYLQDNLGIASDTIRRVSSLIPLKNFRGTGAQPLSDVMKYTHGEQMDKSLATRFGNASANPSPLGMDALVAQYGQGMQRGLIEMPHPVTGQMAIANTTFSENPMSVLDHPNWFTEGSNVSASSLNPEWGGETPDQRATKLRVLGRIPREFVMGPYSSDYNNMSPEDQHNAQSAVNLTRSGLGLTPKTLESSFASLAGDTLHRELQEHLLGDVAGIKHVTYGKERVGNRTINKAVLDPRARAEVRVVQDGISGSLDAIYNNSVLDFKSKVNTGKLLNNAQYMHQMSAYHMMTVENGGMANSERVMQSGIVPVSQTSGLSPEERLAESANAVRGLISRLESAHKDGNNDMFNDVLTQTYGSEYLGGSRMNRAKTIDYIRQANNRLNKGEDWKMGIIPMFGQEAVDQGAMELNLSKRLYDEDKEAIGNDGYIWDASAAKKNFSELAKRVVNKPSIMSDFLKAFRKDRAIPFILPRHLGPPTGKLEQPSVFDADNEIVLEEGEDVLINGELRKAPYTGTFKMPPKSEYSTRLPGLGDNHLNINVHKKFDNDGVPRPDSTVTNENPLTPSGAGGGNSANTPPPSGTPPPVPSANTPQTPFMRSPMRMADDSKFVANLNRVFGDGWDDPEGEGTQYNKHVPEDRLRSFGFNTAQIADIGSISPIAFAQSPHLQKLLQSDTLTPFNQQAIKSYANASFELMDASQRASGNVASGMRDPVATNIHRMTNQMPDDMRNLSMNASGIGKKIQISALNTLRELGAKGDASTERASGFLRSFVDPETGNLAEGLTKSVKELTAGFKAGTAEYDKSMQTFKSWTQTYDNLQTTMAPALRGQNVNGQITEEQYNALSDTVGINNQPLVSNTGGKFSLDVDAYNATIKSIEDTIRPLADTADKAQSVRTQKSWKALVGFSAEGERNKRDLTDSWNAPMEDGKFTQGAFEGMGRNIRTTALASGGSMIANAFNPYNMFAAQRVWGVLGKPAVSSMEVYQTSRMGQEYLGYQGGMLSGEQLAGGMFGKMQSRFALTKERTLAMGRTADFAYGGTADMLNSPFMEGASSVAGLVMPAVGAGMATSALLKGAVGLGAKGAIGLATPLGILAGAGIMAYGGYNALTNAGSDYMAFAQNDPIARLGGGLGAWTDPGEYARKERFTKRSEEIEAGFRSGRGIDDVNLDEFTENEKGSAKYLGFKNTYKDSARAFFGADADTELQNTYRIAQMIDPAFSILSERQTTNNLQSMQLKLGTDATMDILLGASRATNNSVPTIDSARSIASYFANTEDDTLVARDNMNASIGASGVANEYRTLMGQSAIGHEAFLGYGNTREMSFAGSILGSLARTQFSNRGTSENDYLYQATQTRLDNRDFAGSDRSARAYEMSAPVIASGRQIMGLLGASDMSQTVFAGANARLTEGFMENPGIVEGMGEMIQGAARSELMANMVSDLNLTENNGEIQGPVVPRDQLMLVSPPPPPQVVIPNTIFSALPPTNVLEALARNGLQPQLAPPIMDDLMAITYAASLQSANLSVPIEGMNTERTVSPEELQFNAHTDSGITAGAEFLALGGNLPAWYRRQMRITNTSLADSQGIANIYGDMFSQLATSSDAEMQTLIETSLSDDTLEKGESVNARWGVDLIGGQTDYTTGYSGSNAQAMFSGIDNLLGSLPMATATSTRNRLAQGLIDSGLGSANVRQHRVGQQVLNQTTGYLGQLASQGFNYTPNESSELALGLGQAFAVNQPFISSVVGMSGAVRDASLYRVNQSDPHAVRDIELAGMEDMGIMATENYHGIGILAAEYRAAPTRFQTGIMSRTSGMEEGAIIGMSGLNNQDLSTDSIRTNANRLFQEFSDVLINNASLSRQSQNAIGDMILGGGEEVYGDEAVVAGRSRMLGRYSTAMGMMTSRYSATGSNIDDLSAMALETANMTSQQFAQWQGMESQNPYVMSQDLAGAQSRWGSDAVPIAPINLQTGMATTMTQLAPGGNMGFVDKLRDVNKTYGGSFLASYMTDDYLSNIGGVAGIQGEISNLQMSQIGAGAGHGRRMLNMRNAMNLGGGTLDAQGFVVGGSLQPLQQQLASAGHTLNVGNGMTAWQIEDRKTQMSREMSLWDMERQGRDKEMQKRHFYEKWDFGKAQFDYSKQYQQEEMQIGRTQQLTQRAWSQVDMAVGRTQQITQFAWQREDNAFGRAKNALEFGWQTEDYGRNLKYARGRDRIDLLREQERSNIRYNMDVGQADKADSRQDTQEQWASEQFTRQMDRFNQQVIWEDQRFERQIEHFNIINAYELEQMLMQKRHFEEQMGLADEDFEKKKAHTLEMMGLEDGERSLSRQTSLAFADIDQDFSESMAGVQRKIAELSNLLTGISTTEGWTTALQSLRQQILDHPDVKTTGAGVNRVRTINSLDALILADEELNMPARPAPNGAVGGGSGAGSGAGSSGGGLRGALENVNNAFKTVEVSTKALLSPTSGMNARFESLRESVNASSTSISLNRFAFDSLNNASSMANTQLGIATGNFFAMGISLLGISIIGGGAIANINGAGVAFQTLSGVLPDLNTKAYALGMALTNLADKMQQAINTAGGSSGSSGGSGVGGGGGGGGGGSAVQSADGGYTGDGMKQQVANVTVHKGEYVVPQHGTLVMKEGGDKDEAPYGVMVIELRAIKKELQAIRAMGPGRVTANIHTNAPSINTSTITDEQRTRTRL